jgi:bacterioferritin
MNKLPNTYFGEVKDDKINWRKKLSKLDIEPDDDNELPETPVDIIGMLGFDPLHIDDSAEVNTKSFTGKQQVSNISFTLQDLINELNIDLTKEYQAMLQYIQHAACLTGPAMLNVAEELRKHADDEHDHAVLISDHINYLGGIPVAVSDITLTSHDSTQMLTYDIQSEQTAIKRYTERVTQSMGLGEFGTMELIQSILEDEQGHENDLMVVLNVKRGK